ncbi:MAG: glycosyltransferase [Lachnospiraceae bacterium]
MMDRKTGPPGSPKTMLKQYPELFRLISKENGGHGSAINAGTAAAVGRYLKVIDADDWVVTENLKELIDQLAVCRADVVLNPYHQVDMKTGEKTVWKMFLDRYEVTYTLEDVVQNWKKFDRCFAFHGICYNREFYGDTAMDCRKKSSMKIMDTQRSLARMRQVFIRSICIYTNIWSETRNRAYRSQTD